MADKKRSDFTEKTSLSDSDAITLANAGADEKSLLSTVWTYILGKLTGAAATVSNAGTVAIPAGQTVLCITCTPSTSLTMTVDTDSGSTVLVDAETFSAKTTFSIFHHFTTSGTLRFTMNTGTVSVHVKKL